MIRVSPNTSNNTVEVETEGQIQTYTATEWDILWPILVDEIVAGNPIILPTPVIPQIQII